MVEPVQRPFAAHAARDAAQDAANQRVNHHATTMDRAEKFSKSMIAAALRQPMVSLAGANGEPEDDHDPPPIPMKAPIITVKPGDK